MVSYLITTERLGLRAWIKSDIEPFIELNKDTEVMKYFAKVLSDIETMEMLRKINLHFMKNNFGLFAVEERLTKKFIGFTGFAIPTFDSFFTPCIEIGWRYKKEVWGLGVATEAANACLKYGFDTLNFERVVSFTSTVNKSSEKVMQKIDMTYLTNFDHPKIEKDSSLCSHVLYEIKKQQYRAG